LHSSRIIFVVVVHDDTLRSHDNHQRQAAAERFSTSFHDRLAMADFIPSIMFFRTGD
jgi:hypothetical protein